MLGNKLVGKSFFGIACLKEYIEVYSFDAQVGGGLLGWFHPEFMQALIASPDKITVAFGECDLSNKWAARFEDNGHNVVVISAQDCERWGLLEKPSAHRAKSLCHAAVLLQTQYQATQ